MTIVYMKHNYPNAKIFAYEPDPKLFSILSTNVNNFNLKNSHMIPGLMHRFYLTKQTSGKYVAYGTGNPLRQFLYSEDFNLITRDYYNLICID